jgi:molecular chaperone DnaK
MKGGTPGGVRGPVPKGIPFDGGGTLPVQGGNPVDHLLRLDLPGADADDEPTHVGPAPGPVSERRTARNPTQTPQIDEFDDVTSPDARFSGARLPKLPPSRPGELPSAGRAAEPLSAPTQPAWDLPSGEQGEPPLPPGAFADPPPTPRAAVRDTAPPKSDRPPLPLLVDVTPLSLCVETVLGFRDVVIARNTPVPCEQSRTFVTAQDGQDTVLVRVGQGESERFEATTLLGELELLGLPPAPRGSVRIVVTFALDTNGMLDVRAADEETGRESSARLRLVGLPDADDVARMRERHLYHRSL